MRKCQTTVHVWCKCHDMSQPVEMPHCEPLQLIRLHAGWINERQSTQTRQIRSEARLNTPKTSRLAERALGVTLPHSSSSGSRCEGTVPGILCSTEAAIFHSVIHKTGDEVAGLADQWQCGWHGLWSCWALWHLERKRERSPRSTLSRAIHQRCPYPSVCTLNLIRYTLAHKNYMNSTWNLLS